jgi:antirestriction protein ArdC
MLERGYRSPWFGTYEQIKAQGGQVRRGEEPTLVTFWKDWAITEPDEVTGEPVAKSVPVLRYFRVLSAEQADWPEAKAAKYLPKIEAEVKLAELPEPQAVFDAYIANGGPAVRHAPQNRAYYDRQADQITLPEQSQFKTPGGYWETVLHEAGHSTGHKSRLDRPFGEKFGCEKYAKEELVAEMTAAMLLAETGVDAEGVFENNAAYVANWLGALKDDKKLVVQAAAQAGKAAELVMEPSREAVADPEPERERAGVRLAEQTVVGLGSVCRRQNTIKIGLIANWFAGELPIRGFGVKTGGLVGYGSQLRSADSLAWSLDARRSDPLPGCQHARCSNCLEYTSEWRTDLLDRVEAAGREAHSRRPTYRGAYPVAVAGASVNARQRKAAKVQCGIAGEAVPDSHEHAQAPGHAPALMHPWQHGRVPDTGSRGASGCRHLGATGHTDAAFRLWR